MKQWVTTLLVLMALGMANAALADEDWEVVRPSTRTERPGNTKTDRSSENAPSVTVACGEAARPADAHIGAIVNEIASMWGISGASVYESVRPISPHARPGGCVFYNPQSMGYLTQTWMNMHEKDRETPMLYAILAHELGHVYHRDFDRDRQALGSVRCELEADQFAGYTLSRLNIRAENVEGYYRLTGDDFGGVSASHGNSGQRSEAFMQGWRRGQMGLTEQSGIGVGGEDHP